MNTALNRLYEEILCQNDESEGNKDAVTQEDRARRFAEDKRAATARLEEACSMGRTLPRSKNLSFISLQYEHVQASSRTMPPAKAFARQLLCESPLGMAITQARLRMFIEAVFSADSAEEVGKKTATRT